MTNIQIKMIIYTALFLLFVLFFLFLPAWILFTYFIPKDTKTDPMVMFGLCTALGIVLVVGFTSLIRLAGFGFWPLFTLPALTVFLLLSKKNELLRLAEQFVRSPASKTLFILAIILTGVIAQNVVLYRGGWENQQGIMIPSMHDTMWNFALATELYHHYPPQHPGMSGELLKNNHYFYPFFLAIAHAVTAIPFFDLYFRFGPILISLLFGISLYAVSHIYTNRPVFRGLTVFLGYFSGNFAYILPLYFGRAFDWKGSSFFADQPFDQIINPYSVFGFTLLLFIMYCLYRFQNIWLIAGGIMAGMLYGFKSFGAIIAVISLFGTAAISTFLYKDRKALVMLVVTLLVFIPVFFSITEPNVASLRWAPGWLLTEMMVGVDKLNMQSYGQIESYYGAIGNVKGLIKIKTIEFLIYLFGNLGVRLVGAFFFIMLLAGKKKISKEIRIVTLFVSFCILVGFTIPLLFNLGGNSFNIIQFTPYSFVLLAVASAAFCEKAYEFFKRKNQAAIGILLVLVIIFAAIPVNVKNLLSKLSPPNGLLPKDEKEALKFMRKLPIDHGAVLINLKEFTAEDPIYIAALSERRMYLASSGYARQTGRDPEKRLQDIDDFFSGKARPGFAEENNIGYLYVHQPFSQNQVDDRTKAAAFKMLYENDMIIVYGRM